MSNLLTDEPIIEPTPEDMPPKEGESLHIPDFLKDFEGIAELGEEVLSSPTLGHIKDVKTLVKNYVHTKKAFGKDKVELPNKNSTQEQVNEFWSKMGMPQELDKFEIAKPEDSAIEDGFFDGFKEFAFENKVLPEQANKMINFMQEYEKNQNERFEVEAKEKFEQELGGLKDDWATAYDSNLNVVRNSIKEFVSDDVKEYLAKTGMANDPKLVKMVHQLTKDLYAEKPLNVPNPSMGLTKDQALAEYNQLKGDKEGAYWNTGHPDHKRVVDRIVKLREIAF